MLYFIYEGIHLRIGDRTGVLPKYIILMTPTGSPTYLARAKCCPSHLEPNTPNFVDKVTGDFTATNEGLHGANMMQTHNPKKKSQSLELHTYSCKASYMS